MLPLNFKDFLTTGAFVQVGLNTYKILLGPFERVSLNGVDSLGSNTFLYSTHFWDFLENGEEFAQNFVYKPQLSFEVNREDFIGLLNQQFSKEPEIKWENVQESGFKEQYDLSQSWFQENKLQKSVPIILQEGICHLKPEHKIYLLKNLIENKNYGWSYGFFNHDYSMMGHTPEILLSWNRSQHLAHSVALAGTLSAEESSSAQLIMEDPKILQEHQYVIDDICQKINEKKYVKHQTKVLMLKHLIHLKTDFEIEIKELMEAIKLVKKMHPTSAMGCFPENKLFLQQFRQQSLQLSRGLFASPFGFFDENNLQILVSIRNILFTHSKVQIFSGCGITKSSQYDLERIELENKRNSVKKMLGFWND